MKKGDSAIVLNKKAYPFRNTPEGEKLLTDLHVNVQAAKNGVLTQLQRYAYCIAAGTAKADGIEFPFTVEQFVKACSHRWQKLLDFSTSSTSSTSSENGSENGSKTEEKATSEENNEIEESKASTAKTPKATKTAKKADEVEKVETKS